MSEQFAPRYHLAIRTGVIGWHHRPKVHLVRGWDIWNAWGEAYCGEGVNSLVAAFGVDEERLCKRCTKVLQ
jgi:hypothetical protein